MRLLLAARACARGRAQRARGPASGLSTGGQTNFSTEGGRVARAALSLCELSVGPGPSAQTTGAVGVGADPGATIAIAAVREAGLLLSSSSRDREREVDSRPLSLSLSPKKQRARQLARTLAAESAVLSLWRARRTRRRGVSRLCARVQKGGGGGGKEEVVRGESLLVRCARACGGETRIGVRVW